MVGFRASFEIFPFEGNGRSTMCYSQKDMFLRFSALDIVRIVEQCIWRKSFWTLDCKAIRCRWFRTDKPPRDAFRWAYLMLAKRSTSDKKISIPALNSRSMCTIPSPSHSSNGLSLSLSLSLSPPPPLSLSLPPPPPLSLSLSLFSHFPLSRQDPSLDLSFWSFLTFLHTV